ncbi:MAG: family 1 glycosylhydrolase [Bacteroidetes bacterium]|nr:family 1 glycosylhydrolase [Bacteroidota bacterium]
MKGVFLWTWVDNFEWVDGTKPRFGIVYNNFRTQKRTQILDADVFDAVKRNGFIC